MNVCNWCMSGSATGNSILFSVLPRLNNIFNQPINLTNTNQLMLNIRQILIHTQIVYVSVVVSDIDMPCFPSLILYYKNRPGIYVDT